MADSSGQADIRGIDIDKLAKGFADEANIFKSFCTVSKTSAREIRWYQKTSGFLDTTDSTGMTASRMDNVSFRARPEVVEQSWTRQTSYVRKFFVESPTISMEDIKDSDPDILGTNVRDIVRSVARKVDARIYSVLVQAAAATPTTPNPSTVNYTAAVADGWNDTATGDPIKDILVGKRKIRQKGYDPEGSVTLMNSLEHEYLLNHLINVKGSSIPQFSSEKVKSGVVMEILGTKVVVSEHATTDWVIQFVPGRALTYKQFLPLTTAVMDEPGIGKKIRCWEEGECLLTDVGAVHIITDTTV